MKNHSKILFIIITFFLSFSLAGIFKLLGGQYEGTGGTILASAYMFMPMISAILVERLILKEKITTTLFISFRLNKWFLVAWLIPPVLAFLTLGVSLLLPDVTYSPEMTGMIKRFEGVVSPDKLEQMKQSFETMPVHPIWLSLVSGLVAGITLNAVAGFGEELGWRGFLLKEFRYSSFLKASVIIGFIWGIWHSPIILMGHNYPQHPQIGVLMMIIWCILLTPLFLYITIKAKSVIAAAIMHGTLNATAGIAIMLIEGGNDLTVGVTGLAGFIALIIVLSALFIYDIVISKEKIMISKISNYL